MREIAAQRWNRWRGQGMVHLKRAASRLQVAAPYNAQFPPLARAIPGAKYKFRSRIWSFPITQHTAVITALITVYGSAAIVEG